jgi:hypothetical protein
VEEPVEEREAGRSTARRRRHDGVTPAPPSAFASATPTRRRRPTSSKFSLLRPHPPLPPPFLSVVFPALPSVSAHCCHILPVTPLAASPSLIVVLLSFSLLIPAPYRIRLRFVLDSRCPFPFCLCSTLAAVFPSTSFPLFLSLFRRNETPVVISPLLPSVPFPREHRCSRQAEGEQTRQGERNG